MQVGLTLDLRNAATRRRPWREFWEDGLWLLAEAEALGFDSVLLQEHFFMDDGYAPSLPVFLALLAERTQRIRIGSYLYILPLHHPAALAQETAVLDQWSGGRLEVTVGLGHRLAEYRAFGIDPATRASRMEESLQVLRLAWTQRPFDFQGEHFQLQGVEVRPEPLQVPHPPLWVGATTAPAARRAGRHGAFLAGASVDPSVYEDYREAWRASGRAPSEARASSAFSLTTTREDPEAVWTRNRELYFERWDFYRRIRSELGDPSLAVGSQADTAGAHPEAPSPEAYRENEIIGSPEEILEFLRPRVTELGLTDVVLNGPASGIDWRGEGYESVRCFAEEVLPALREL